MYIGANFIKWCKQADISNPLFDLEKDSCDLKNLRTQKMCSMSSFLLWHVFKFIKQILVMKRNLVYFFI